MFHVIYADPPWLFKTRSDKGTGRSPKYPKLTVSEMKKLPVVDVANKNAILLMWATWPLLDQAIDLGRAWGFAYKTAAFVWAKCNKQALKAPRQPITGDYNWFASTGYYTRSNTEMVLLFSRGRLQRRAKNVRQLIVAPRGRHSAKPHETYDRIERLFPGPYLELFAREEREGWVSLGNEVGSREDIRDSLPCLISSLEKRKHGGLSHRPEPFSGETSQGMSVLKAATSLPESQEIAYPNSSHQRESDSKKAPLAISSEPSPGSDVAYTNAALTGM